MKNHSRLHDHSPNCAAACCPDFCRAIATVKERRRENIGSKGALQILLRPSAPIFAAQLEQLKKGGGGISVVKELRLYSCRSIFESVSVTEALQCQLNIYPCSCCQMLRLPSRLRGQWRTGGIRERYCCSRGTGLTEELGTDAIAGAMKV